MAIINHFELSIKPHYLHKDILNFEICVSTDHNRFIHNKTLKPDDMTSRFDRMFEIAKHELKEEIERSIMR